MASIIIEVIGWIGAILILLAYFLLTHRDLTSRSKLYQWLNLIGSLFVGLNAIFNRAYPSFTINLFWLLIALYGLSKAFRPK